MGLGETLLTAVVGGVIGGVVTTTAAHFFETRRRDLDRKRASDIGPTLRVLALRPAVSWLDETDWTSTWDPRVSEAIRDYGRDGRSPRCRITSDANAERLRQVLHSRCVEFSTVNGMTERVTDRGRATLRLRDGGEPDESEVRAVSDAAEAVVSAYGPLLASLREVLPEAFTEPVDTTESDE